MKWQGYDEKAADRVNKVVAKVVGSRAFYTIVALASLAMVLAASFKWRG